MSSGTPLSRAAAAIVRSHTGAAAASALDDEIAESSAVATRASLRPALAIARRFLRVRRRGAAVVGEGMGGRVLRGRGGKRLAADDEVVQRAIAGAEAGGEQCPVVLDS